MESFTADENKLYLGDFLKGIRNEPENSYDLAIADPPYGASTTADWSLPEDHSLPGFGGEWEIAGHDWDLEKGGLEGFEFVIAWLNELQRVVKPSGSIWIHSTYHNSGIVNVACQMLSLEIINEVVWYKRNAFPNLSGRRLTASHENILWVHTGEDRNYRFNYESVKSADFPEDNLKEGGKQMRTVWDIPTNKDSEELRHGKHPTQKPLRLLRRLFMTAGSPGGRALIPFAGSGSEMVAGISYGMKVTGFEVKDEYFDIAKKRVEDAAYKSKKSPTLFRDVKEQEEETSD